jgi:predicted RNA-binding protein Jag
VNNFRRFLIHKTVEQFKDLKTFSIGEGDGRRTIVCFLEVFER